MASITGTQLAQSVRQKIAELKGACAGLDEVAASRAPAGRWSPKEILSHLWGPEGSGHLPMPCTRQNRHWPPVKRCRP